MTVVSIRCSECDEVKDEEKITLNADGAICDECRTNIPEEVRDANSDEDEVSKEEVAKSGDESDDSADTPNESEETEDSDENAEGDKKPVEESFNEQDPLEW